MKTPVVRLYTDGAAQYNPGAGGYAAILLYQGLTKILSGAYRRTTNNRMELLAVIKGLEALTKAPQQVQVYADSKYVVDAVEKGWLMRWRAHNFKGKKNVDLWQRFLRVYQKHRVVLHWVKGHAGHPENEQCDALATQRAAQGPWQVDQGYESNPKLV